VQDSFCTIIAYWKLSPILVTILASMGVLFDKAIPPKVILAAFQVFVSAIGVPQKPGDGQ
jgi:hypothetical protein